jgi:hypothetical protein
MRSDRPQGSTANALGAGGGGDLQPLDGELHVEDCHDNIAVSWLLGPGDKNLVAVADAGRGHRVAGGADDKVAAWSSTNISVRPIGRS